MRPNDEDAKRLAHQTYHLAEFLQQEGYEPPPLMRKAVLHEHCHQHATRAIDPDRKLLEAMGVEVEVPDSGCCGMAGAWGYERGHYDVSMACGERVLLPKGQGRADTLVVTAGFSCRSQIEHATERRALHLAKVIQLARDHGAVARPARIRNVPLPRSQARLGRAGPELSPSPARVRSRSRSLGRDPENRVTRRLRRELLERGVGTRVEVRLCHRRRAQVLTQDGRGGLRGDLFDADGSRAQRARQADRTGGARTLHP